MKGCNRREAVATAIASTMLLPARIDFSQYAGFGRVYYKDGTEKIFLHRKDGRMEECSEYTLSQLLESSEKYQ
jgi:hypothetical protein